VNLYSLFRPAQPVPDAYHSNFRHLYFDIAWYGLLAASAMSFVTVYAARQGANAFQIGLFSAGPAVVNLLFTLPAGRWLETQPVDRAVSWAAALNRFFYLLWVPLPMLLAPELQIWTLIGLTLLMSIPATAVAVGFNALFADAVIPEWRGYVVGIRNALLSMIFIAISLLCGQILNTIPFPHGYQVVFAIGFVGGAMSTFHVSRIKPYPNGRVRPRSGQALGDLARPGVLRVLADGLRHGAGLRFLIRRRGFRLLQTDVLKGPFGRLVAVLFAFHLALNLAIPLFPFHWVNNLHLTDREIGLGTAVFYVAVFLGSTQLAQLTRRWGNQRLTAIGAMFMSTYPALMALSHGLGLFLVASAAGGFGWSLAGGALTNYILEKVPEDHRPPYLAWYNLALNAAVLLGSLAGPFLGGVMGVTTALMVFAGFRLLAAVAILRWE
jgi:MFS family permease